MPSANFPGSQSSSGGGIAARRVARHRLRRWPAEHHPPTFPGHTPQPSVRKGQSKPGWIGCMAQSFLSHSRGCLGLSQGVRSVQLPFRLPCDSGNLLCPTCIERSTLCFPAHHKLQLNSNARANCRIDIDTIGRLEATRPSKLLYRHGITRSPNHVHPISFPPLRSYMSDARCARDNSSVARGMSHTLWFHSIPGFGTPVQARFSLPFVD